MGPQAMLFMWEGADCYRMVPGPIPNPGVQLCLSKPPRVFVCLGWQLHGGPLLTG